MTVDLQVDALSGRLPRYQQDASDHERARDGTHGLAPKLAGASSRREVKRATLGPRHRTERGGPGMMVATRLALALLFALALAACNTPAAPPAPAPATTGGTAQPPRLTPQDYAEIQQLAA